MTNDTNNSGEKKEKQRQVKSVMINLIIASLIMFFAFITTFFDFDTLSSKLVIASAIIVAAFFCGIMLVRYLKSMDEFEYTLNARACLVGMYSSLLYLPIQYLSELELIPELHVAFLFMGMWFIYLLAIFYYHYK